jgi:hypothetical protein
MSTTETNRGNFEDVARRDLRDDDDREPRAIERDIDATRADMRATLEALERRFSFERLVDMTVGRIRERGGEFAGNLTDAATQNPMPLLLTSIGLGWLMLTSRRGPRGNGASYSTSGDYGHDYDDREGSLRAGARSLRERADSIRDHAARAADKAHGVVESTRETMNGAMDSVHQTAESLRSGASRAVQVTREQKDRVNRLLHEQPLMLGAVGLAAGAIIGALLPTTEREDRMFGEMRDKAVKEVAQQSRAKFETAREQVTAALRTESGTDDGAASESKPASRPH